MGQDGDIGENVPRELLGQVREEKSSTEIQRDLRLRLHKQLAWHGKDFVQPTGGRGFWFDTLVSKITQLL